MTTGDIDRQESKVGDVLGSARFWAAAVSGNEAPFYIWPYAPTDELWAQAAVARLVNRLQTKDGRTVVTIDLFDLSCELLAERGPDMLDQLDEVEPTLTRDDLRDALQLMLDPQTHLAPAIRRRLDQRPDYDICFLTGIGRVYPFIRSHTVLNNLATAMPRKPMVMLFPGEYRQSATLGSALVLFGQLSDDQYYRAKNILEQES
jgi:hypothetical protein